MNNLTNGRDEDGVAVNGVLELRDLLLIRLFQHRCPEMDNVYGETRSQMKDDENADRTLLSYSRDEEIHGEREQEMKDRMEKGQEEKEDKKTRKGQEEMRKDKKK
ncbi:hypothetical protein AVEN_88521-1 [Araneus ventricosus]|uniref:Uncharacterized protein n=1 Tax=Araneus ventricosus TaxID=182803 RepID=A0A4Y2E4Q8_ARAVE|nr:hypothetical protein AVEN_88521-1 [Araneus ventricosus]